MTDILEALDKRGLDPREQLQVFAFDPNVHTIGDLREGMLLPGIVTNITAFGAFVDIGVKQDGLVHISQLADRYVASPADVVHLGQHVEVRVTGVDTGSRTHCALDAPRSIKDRIKRGPATAILVEKWPFKVEYCPPGP